jgi:peptidyl-prolyl cis-trans isomerase D
MLNALRKGAGTWVAKILFALLVASFALWGVGDWTGGFRREKLAEVGGQEITQAEFERAYQAQLTAASNQIGRQITSAEARAAGMTQRVLQDLVAGKAIDIHADALNLGISEKAIVESIHDEAAFQGDDGKFNAQRFQQVLRQVGLTEPTFVAMQRREIIKNQILGTLIEAPYAPRALVEAMHHFRNDERVLKYFLLPPEAAGTIDAPTEEKLKAYYEEHKRSFMAPEFRRASVLVLSAEKLKTTIPVSDEDVKAAYEAGKKSFSVPEKRTIQQLVFKDKAAAEEASAKLAAGADFMTLGKELGLKETDINLGTFAQDGFGDQTVAKAAFQLEKDKPSAPISGFSTVIVRVTEIQPGSQKSFEEVKDQVKDQLAASRASEEISKLYDKIEDERAAGSTLQEIAQKMNLEFTEITVNKQGAGRDGKKPDVSAKSPNVVKTIFEGDVGVESNAAQLGEDGYAFVDVLEIIPERQRPFEEVREDVAKAWTEEETRTRLTAKADELVAAIGKGQAIDEAAKAVNASVKTSQPLKRAGAEPGLPISAVAQAFSLAQDGVGSAQTPDRKGRAVFQVAEIKPAAALDDKGVEELRKELARGLGNDIYAQYVNGLQTAYGVQVNAKAISQVTGQTTQ